MQTWRDLVAANALLGRYCISVRMHDVQRSVSGVLWFFSRETVLEEGACKLAKLLSVGPIGEAQGAAVAPWLRHRTFTWQTWVWVPLSLTRSHRWPRFPNLARFARSKHSICSVINITIHLDMKKRSEATQTLRAGCSKVDPQTNTQTGAITIHCTA